jgi:tetratricopeptide (TPR) repeat protein
MLSEADRLQRLQRAQELKQLAESARRRDHPLARKCYEEAVALFRAAGNPLRLAHTIRHLGDVYREGQCPHLAEPCYLEALELYRHHEKTPSLDLANALRSLAVLREEQARALWEEAGHIYTTLQIAPGVKEATTRLQALSKN